ncbi:unnamed protein product [Closterium sp. NIES-53]
MAAKFATHSPALRLALLLLLVSGGALRPAESESIAGPKKRVSLTRPAHAQLMQRRQQHQPRRHQRQHHHQPASTSVLSGGFGGRATVSAVAFPVVRSSVTDGASHAATAAAAAIIPAASAPPIKYHGGPVIVGNPTVNVYHIYYGSWGSGSGREIIDTFVQALSSDSGRSNKFDAPVGGTRRSPSGTTSLTSAGVGRPSWRAPGQVPAPDPGCTGPPLRRHLGDTLPRLRSMHSRLLVSGLPRSLPALPPSPAPPCIPCVEGRQRAAPHSSSFPPTEAPLQTLHLDMWGPARVRGQGHERYFLLVVDDYTRYTTVFPLQRKGDVPDVLIPWIRATRLQLRERFQSDFPVLRLHSDRGGEFSSDLLAAFCAAASVAARPFQPSPFPSSALPSLTTLPTPPPPPPLPSSRLQARHQSSTTKGREIIDTFVQVLSSDSGSQGSAADASVKGWWVTFSAYYQSGSGGKKNVSSMVRDGGVSGARH